MVNFYLFLVCALAVIHSSVSLSTDSVCKTSYSSSSEVRGAGPCVGDIFLKGNYVEVGIHKAASYGTSVNGPSTSAYGSQRLGFIADFDKNGWSGSPGYAGDYFVPGAPVEGWVVQYKESGTVKKAINMGLYNRMEVTPASVEITSNDDTQSVLWVGHFGNLKVSKVTQFGNNDVYFTTSVTYENTGSSPLTDVYYMRTVDPDQEKVYYGQYRTLNYVKYQPAAADGSDCCLTRDYVNDAVPSMSLVVAVGKNNKNFFLGMGSTNPNIRVSHHGFYMVDPVAGFGDGSGNKDWHYYGGNDVEPTVAYESRMHYADKAVHLTWKKNSLGPGETAQFSFAHVLNEDDLVAAMSTLTIMSFLQPTADMSGVTTVAVRLLNHTATSCVFSVYGIKPSVSLSAQWYEVGTDTPSTPASAFSTTFDCRAFEDGSVQLRAIAVDGASTYTQYKAAGVANAGTQMRFIQDDLGGVYPFANTGLTVLNMTKDDPSDLDPVSVSFFIEVFSGGEVSSTLINTVTSAPYETSVDVSEFFVGQSISIKASVVSGSTSQYKTTTIFSGVVTLVNNAPTDIVLSSSTVPEGTATGVAIGSFISSDIDAGQGHTYTLVDDAGGLVQVVGGVLMVNRIMNFESGFGDYYGTSFAIRVRTDDGQDNHCCFEKDFVVTVTDKNDAPQSITPANLVVQENTAISTVVGTLAAVDEDCCDSHTFSLLTYEADFSISASTGQVMVTGSIDFESQSSYTLAVRVTDNGSPNEKLDSTVTVTVQDVNESPTGISISCNPCTIDENTVATTVVATLTGVDADTSETLTFSNEAFLSTPFLSVDAAGVVSTASDINFEETGPELVLYARVTDSGGLFVVRPFTFLVNNLPEVPTSDGIVCYCDEDRISSAIVSSDTELDPLFCQVPANGGDSDELLFTILHGDSIANNLEDTFTIQSCSGMVMVNNSHLLDFERHDFYNLTVRIESVGGIIHSNVVIHVVNVNEAPTFASLSVSIDENSVVGTEVVSSLLGQVTDSDDVGGSGAFCCEKTFQIVSGNIGNVFYLMDVTTGQLGVNSAALNFESVSQYILTMTVTDKGGLFAAATVTVNVNDLNESPILVQSSGTFSTIAENKVPGDQTGLGIYAIDYDAGQTLSMSITAGNTGDVFTLTQVFDAGLNLNLYYFTIASGKSLDFETTSSYTLQVTATDDAASPLSDVGTFVIAVSDVNEAPTVPATKSFSIEENSAVGTLVGTALLDEYADPDADSIASFSIFNYGGDGAKYFDLDSITGQLSLRSTFLSFETVSSFTYTIRVTDGGGLFDSCVVTISVTDINETPIWQSPNPADVLEGVAIGANITFFNEPLNFDVDDDDADTLTFAVVSVNGDTVSKDQFAIQEVPGENSFTLLSNVVFDYETEASYTVVVSASDSEYTVNSPAISISVTDQNDAPSIAASTQTCVVSAGAAAGTTICEVIGVDVDSPALSWGTLTYSFPDAVTYTGLSIVTTDGVGILTVTDSSSWTAGDEITGIIVRAIDGGVPALEDQQTITLTVTTTNDPPACPTTPLAINVAENSAAGVSLGTLSSSSNSAEFIYDAGSPLICSITAGNAAGHFALSPACELTTTSVPTNFEGVNSFTITVSAVEDNGAASLRTSCPVVVSVTDVNEPTTMVDQSFSTNEISSYSGPLQAPGVGGALTVLITDEDALDQPSALSNAFSLSCVSCGADPLDINATTGVLQLKTGFSLNYEDVKTYVYTVSWSNRGVTVTATVDLSILDINEPPLAVASTLSIPEDQAAGIIGYMTATDPDFEDVVDFGSSFCEDNCGLKYVIVSSTSGALSMDRSTGAIRLSELGVDYENAVSHTISAKVTDLGGLVSFATITIAITDVADCGISLLSSLAGRELNATSTAGGVTLLVTGRNFGPTQARMTSAGLSESSITLTASLQSGAVTSSASYVYSMPCVMHRTAPHDNTAMSCTVPAGIGANLGAVVTISVDYGGSIGATSCTTSFSASRMSYATPGVDAISSATDLSTAGGAAITVTGSNFGPLGVEYNLVTAEMSNDYFSTTVDCTVAVAHTTLICVAAGGIGADVEWTISVGGQTSPKVSGLSSFGLPDIESITTLEPFDTTGGVRFTVDGTNFGDDIVHLRLSYGPVTGMEYVTSCSYEIAHTRLSCLSSAGVGKNLKFKIVVAAQESVLKSTNIDYKTPVVGALTGAGTSYAATEGGDVVYITGSQFGPLSTSTSDIVVTYGATATELTAMNCHVITASTKIQCMTAPGTGKGHNWLISIGGQASGVFVAGTAYAPPTVSSFEGVGSSLALTSGYQEVIINGLNFGPTMSDVDKVYYSEPNKTKFEVTENCTMTSAHSVLHCLTAPGAGSRLSWIIIVDGQESVAPTTSYGLPSITGLSGAGVVDADVTGGQEVVLTGRNFGTPNSLGLYGTEFLESVTYGPSGTEYKASNCMVQAATRISCNTVAGVGGGLFWQVTVAGQVSALSTTTSSYAKPVITSMSPATGNTDGSTTVILQGTNFATNTNPIVLFGNNENICANEGGSCSCSGQVHYGRKYSSGMPGNGSLTSFSDMQQSTYFSKTVAGTTLCADSNFGDPAFGYYKHCICVPTEPTVGVVSSLPSGVNRLTFFVPEAVQVQSNSYLVYINVGGQISNTQTFRYNDPVIYTLNTVDGVNETITLVITGAFFSLKPIVRIDETDSDQTVFPFCSRLLHDEIECSVISRSGLVTVTTFGESNAMRYEYGEPRLLSSDLNAGSPLTSGHTPENPAQLFIIGQNFGKLQTDFVVNVEFQYQNVLTVGDCRVTLFQYISKTDNLAEWQRIAALVTGEDVDADLQQLTCNLPPGQGSDNSIRIVRPNSYSLGCGCLLCSPESCFSYDAPVVDSIAPPTGNTDGGYTVVVAGSNFGLNASVLVNDAAWDIDRSMSGHTELHLTSDSYEGANHVVKVTAGNQDNSGQSGGQKFFSYNAPTVDPFLSTLVVGTAGSSSSVTVTGSNFGVLGPTVKLGDERLDLVSFTHSELEFFIPPGQGKNLVLEVNVSDQLGYSVDSFSYIPPHITTASRLQGDTQGGRMSGLKLSTITGSNFGSIDKPFSLRFGSDFVVPMEDIVSYTSTQIQFYHPEGQGQDVLLNLTVGGQAASGGPLYFSYNPPVLTSVVVPEVVNTKGGSLVTLHGTSFGSADMTVMIADPLFQAASSADEARIRAYQATGDEYEIQAVNINSLRMEGRLCVIVSHTHTMIECKAPAGVGGDLQLTVDVSGQTVATNFSYSLPTISYYQQRNGGNAAGGETLKIHGINFGAWRTPLNITLGDVRCKSSVWLADDPVYGYQPYLQCSTPKEVVGFKNVTLSVAFQVSEPDDTYQVSCKKGYYGGLGEYCVNCGDPELTGLICDRDNLYEPISANGWYLTYHPSGAEACPDENINRVYCPVVQPCIPLDSCLGNNTCSKEYEGPRCATCAEGYYRINGLCQECPSAPWAIVVAGIGVLICGSYIGYKLQKKNVNLGILSIGIDYFQVLAVFGSANVQWPQSLVNMYNSFSIFNLNVDVAAPECWDAVSMSFRTKWYGVSASPVVALMLLTVATILYVLYYKIRGIKINMTETLYKAFAVYLLLFYYGYLMLSNNTLAVFNCQPTTPSDGYRYMVEVGADGGQCYKSGTMQQELEPWAIITFIVYTIGFPAFVGFILYTNRDKAIYAQVMLAAGKANNSDFEKQSITRFRMCYSRLYFQFKPEYFYWIFFILIRKFCLSVAAIIFRENTVFLLALYLLVLFFCYTLNVNYKPYMSTSEYPDIVEKYQHVLSMNQRENPNQARRSFAPNIRKLGGDEPIFKAKTATIAFFNNYNTVESYLLFSAIMVAIAAIMFESDQLSTIERDSLAYLVICIVAVSLGYFAFVLFTELWVAFFPHIPLFWMTLEEEEEELDHDIEFADVTMARDHGDDDHSNKLKAQYEAKLENAEGMIAEMQDEINSLKKAKKNPTLLPPKKPTNKKKKTLGNLMSRTESEEIDYSFQEDDDEGMTYEMNDML